MLQTVGNDFRTPVISLERENRVYSSSGLQYYRHFIAQPY